jgi:hypothetical protein
MGLINNSTLVPPMSMGRNVSEEEWNRMFPNRPKANYEKQEDYEARKETLKPQNES